MLKLWMLILLNRRVAPLLFCYLLLASSAALAQKNQTSDAAKLQQAAADAQSEESVKPQVIDQVGAIIEDINRAKADIRALDKQLSRTNLETQREQLEQEKKVELTKLENLHKSLEQIATGAVDLSLFEQPISEDFSWQAELKDVFQPLLLELKKLTERPRQIERLRSEQNTLRSQLEAAKLAVEEIEVLASAVEASAVKKTLGKLLKEWRETSHDLESRLQLVSFQLDEKLYSDESKSVAVMDAVKSFFTGRGANLLLAFGAFIASFATLRYLSHALERVISKGRDSERRFFGRLVHVVFQVLTLVLSIFALMATLYAVSDWLILTLLIIVLIGFIFALRNSLPRYMEEVRLLLNLGPVREGERVIYNGLPWRVSRLNIYSDLVNPLLTGGRLRLPTREMLKLVSRRWSRNEPWFPSKPNDFLLLADGTYGKVLLQTPECVQVAVEGGALKTYPVADFLAAAPHNLSQEGFGLFVNFGLDYSLQAQITSQVMEALQMSIDKALQQAPFAEFVKESRVEFAEAASSSLNLMMMVFFTGEAAHQYYPIQRFLQGAAVNACNEHNWTIPFNQITLHRAGADHSALG
ncbi:MAG: hypothetical protein KTR17_05795 [Cellvibrionaceae bacterium]|nr:hypothetical protein [Cellvibrionaceae bacterium]